MCNEIWNIKSNSEIFLGGLGLPIFSKDWTMIVGLVRIIWHLVVGLGCLSLVRVEIAPLWTFRV